MKSLKEYTVYGKAFQNTGRVLSVDALRGFDMFWITGGATIITALHGAVQSPFTKALSTQMDHVEWTGFHFFDIIMPLFLFLVGIAMPYSFSRRIQKGESKQHLLVHVFKRVLILWVLGMLVQGKLLTYDFSQFAFFSNTLQAIAIGYLISSFLILYVSAPGQIIATVMLLLLYWFISTFISMGGQSAGIFRPESNIPIYIDKLILGNHQDGTTYSWILSSLNFGVTVMTGVFTAFILQNPSKGLKKALTLFLSGMGLIIAGLLFNFVHPLVKHIWTSSFVLFSSGICIAMLSFFYLIVDHWKFTRWTKFFIVIGSNSIFAYLLGELYSFKGFAEIFLKGTSYHLGCWYPFVLAIGAYAVFWFILYHLYKQKIFIKI
ncbi:MAG: DUF5009 domain-containing protein [Bacteroidota bacterium]|nr:DUF5009 domain-containing protein [Bacteroidota bacterium]MDP4205262.1 DUF5009 domain-containing protein [Bacteroidota bacterium]